MEIVDNALGALISQLIVPSVRERTIFTSLLLAQSGLAWLIQSIGVGSSALFFLSGLPLYLALVLSYFVAPASEVSLLSYAVGLLVPLTTGSQMAFEVLNVFVPLVHTFPHFLSAMLLILIHQTGRMGVEAPAEHIIATIVAVVGSYVLSLVVPFIHRFPRAVLHRSILLMITASVISIAVFSARNPFDTMHQKRLFVIHMENVRCTLICG